MTFTVSVSLTRFESLCGDTYRPIPIPVEGGLVPVILREGSLLVDSHALLVIPERDQPVSSGKSTERERERERGREGGRER